MLLYSYTIVVMETTALSKKYTKVNYPKKIAIVVGNEVTGVHPAGCCSCCG